MMCRDADQPRISQAFSIAERPLLASIQRLLPAQLRYRPDGSVVLISCSPRRTVEDVAAYPDLLRVDLGAQGVHGDVRRFAGRRACSIQQRTPSFDMQSYGRRPSLDTSVNANQRTRFTDRSQCFSDENISYKTLT